MDSKTLLVKSAAAATTAGVAYCLYRMQRRPYPLPLPAIHKPQFERDHTAIATKAAGSVFVFGLGFTGTRFARALLQQGWKVAGTVRDQKKAEEFRREGIEAFVFDSDDQNDENNGIAEITAVLASCTHVLLTAAPVAPKRGAAASAADTSTTGTPPPQGDPVLSRAALHSALQQAAVAGVLTWVGYLSSVGVYGGWDGQEVDERTTPAPTSTRGKRRRDAEIEWQTSGLPVMVFRLPGIYGPGRGPIAKVRSGKARRIVKKGQIFSRIHVDDIVGTLMASIAHPCPGDVYNVVDDRPAPPGIVVAYACHLLQLPVPPEESFETAELSAMARSFYGECRYIRNTLIKRKLGVELLYPTYRQGLAAQLREEEQQNSQGVLGAWKAALSAPVRAQLTCEKPNMTIPNGYLQHDVTARHTHIVLVDNGSLRGAATVNLRRVACALLADRRVPGDAVVHATSARWSNRADVDDLDGGPPAELFEECLRRIAADADKRGAQCHIVVLPYFFGPSSTVTDFCPDVARKVMAEFGPALVEVRIAPPLHCPCPYLARLLPEEQRILGPDNRLARILTAKIEESADANSIALPLHHESETEQAAPSSIAVLVCDHGTPTRSVNAVREQVTADVAKLLEGRVASVSACSMERRKGAAFDYNEPLLETALTQLPHGTHTVFVALLFLGPGKHAGKDGDIAEIIASVQREKGVTATVHTTSVLAEDPLIIDILTDRLHQGVSVQ